MKKTLPFILILFLFPPQPVFPQEEGADSKEKGLSQADIVDAVSKGYKKALEMFEMEKAAEKNRLLNEIRSSLDILIDKWLAGQREDASGGLNDKVTQEWQMLANMPPEHIDYYLRDFEFSIQEKNITETNSVTYPYNAVVDIRKRLYVDQAPLMGMPREKYQYTANIIIRLSLSYSKEPAQWDIADTKEINTTITHGWPEALRQKLTSFFIPKE